MDYAPLEPIAIIGFAATFPFTKSTAEDFWESICKGESAWGEVPADRFNVNGFYHPDIERLDTLNTKGGNFLNGDPYKFDAQFFRISPSEAAAMDPQHRGVMECTFQALESAGLRTETVAASSTSVFAANSSTLDYPMMIGRDRLLHSKYESTGTGAAIMANRISQFFDLRGPSMTLNTACSSSMYALHLGCQSLRSGESRMSIIVASNLILGPDGAYTGLSNGNLLSNDGITRSFDARASGYTRGEGHVALIIKRSRDAVSDRDPIRSIIRSTAVNASGKTLSLTQPSSRAQSELIRQAYDMAGLDLSDTQYFEAHGTGTRVGDPIEAEAIGLAFGGSRPRQSPLLVGSVKANIGHLEAASGLASIVKAIQMQEHGLIPPQINLDHVNPEINSESLGIEFPLKLLSWPTEGLRRISVNNFGFGGANAHAVLDDAKSFLDRLALIAQHDTLRAPLVSAFPPLDKNHSKQSIISQSQASERFTHPVEEKEKLLVISASDEPGLDRQLHALHDYLEDLDARSQPSLGDIAFTLSEKRNKLSWRSFLTARTTDDIQKAISSMSHPHLRGSRDLEIDFIFTGQGAHWCTMGSDLLCYPSFYQSVEEAEAFLYSLGCSWSVKDELANVDIDRLSKPQFSQVLCTILQVALTDLLSSWGIKTQKVVGHSSGEIAAAYACGAIDRYVAWSLAYYRGLSIAEASRSPHDAQSMIAVALTSAEGTKMLESAAVDSELCIACVNSPTNITLAGTVSAIDKVEAILKSRGTFTRQLSVTCAYHSPYMNHAAQIYKGMIKDLFGESLIRRPTSVQMFSSVSGSRITQQELADADYWVKNILSPVQFDGAVSSLLSSSLSSETEHIFIEVGPHPALRNYVVEIVESSGLEDKYTYLPLLRRGSHEAHALNAAGYLWAKGYNVDTVAANNTITARSPKFLVDFPKYPFNHEHAHQMKSRLVDAFSYHSLPRNEYVGLRDTDWTRRRASWRNVISVDELPWTRDHGFGETSVYPGAGFLVMALEACRQLIGDEKPISGFRFRNVFWKRTLQLNEEEGNETRILLESDNDDTVYTELGFDFSIQSISQGDWADICYGVIRAEFHQHDSEPMTRSAHHDFAQQQKTLFNCNFQVHHEHFYRNLKKNDGLQFGPRFRLLRDLRYSKAGHGSATLPLEMRPISVASMPKQNLFIHPCELDALFQIPLVVLSEGGWKRIPPMVVTRVDEMWLSASILDMEDRKLGVSTELTMDSLKDRTWNSMAVDPHTDLPVILARSFTGTALQSFADTEAEQAREDTLMFFTKWLPDLKVNPKETIQAYFDRELPASFGDVADQCDQMAYQHIERILQGASQIRPVPKYLKQYLDWLRNISAKRDSSREKTAQSHGLMENHWAKVIDLVGLNLLDILSGKVDPLEMFFGSSTTLEDFYNTSFAPSNKSLHDYFEVLAHENPNLQVLEVGAGTGSATKAILSSLSKPISEQQILTCFAKYVFTDISPSFFEKAKQIFSDYEHRMEFKTLDITQNSKEQGFEEESFDVIVAAAVVHATPNIHRSLTTLRKLLKPGGVLVMVEQCGPRTISTCFAFGVLPSWWQAEEDYRQEGPLMSQTRWETSLRESGFRGIDLAIKDSLDEENYLCAVLVSRKPGLQRTDSDPKLSTVRIIRSHHSLLQSETAKLLKAAISKTGHTQCILETLEEMDPANLDKGTCVLSLLDLDGDILDNIAPSSFSRLKSILLIAETMIWATTGSSMEPSSPQRSKVEGLSRALCSEKSELSFSVVVFNDDETPLDMTANLMRILGNDSQTREHRMEPIYYADKDNILQISRIVPKALANILNDDPESTKAPVGDMEIVSTLRLEIESAGQLDTLAFKEHLLHSKDLQADEIEIEVGYSSLNFKDVLIAFGRVPGKHLGSDAAGVVRRAGSESGFRVGDRVCVCTKQAIATIVRCKALRVVLVPEQLSLVAAAAIPSAFCTVYHSLVRVAMLKPGESVLIHTAAGGVGQYAVQLARFLNARIFVTAGTPAKRLMLHEEYGIPLSNIFSSRDSTFASGILASTSGKGVDVVLNSVTGDLLQASFDILAPFGRFVELGKRDISNASRLVMSTFDKNVSFSSIDLGLICDQNIQLFSTILNEAMDLVANNLAAFPGPKPMHTFPAKDASKAFRALAGGKLSGKALISFESTDDLKVVRSRVSSPIFNSDATYVLSGGFGGIGRSLIYWMLDKGAKHILILSRSGRKATTTSEQLDHHARMHQAEIVSVKCDVSVEEEVVTAIKNAESKTPPIKGCFQLAMTLKDSLFQDMSADDFLHPFGPKVAGSWNLHTTLPRELDFFIMFSSVSGCYGAPGQSNYCAANTYQDALARHRVANGLKAFSLNLGLVLGFGYAADNFEVTATLERQGYAGMTERQLLEILEKLCNPRLPLPEPADAQIGAAISLPRDFRKAGKEPAGWLGKVTFNHLHCIEVKDERVGGAIEGAPQSQVDDLVERVRNATTKEKALAYVSEALQEKIANAVDIPKSAVDISKPLFHAGLDSLVAVEMRTWFLKKLKVDMAVNVILSEKSGRELSEMAVAPYFDA